MPWPWAFPKRALPAPRGSVCAPKSETPGRLLKMAASAESLCICLESIKAGTIIGDPIYRQRPEGSLYRSMCVCVCVYLYMGGIDD